MVKITYIQADGTEHVVDVEPGLSVMRGAVEKVFRGLSLNAAAIAHAAPAASMSMRVGSHRLAKPPRSRRRRWRFVKTRLLESGYPARSR